MRGCRKISHESPATVAIYANATATRHDEVREFRSFDELERWLCKPIAKPTDKRDVPLFARARVDGPRKKKNLTGPLLVVLDVDKSDASMDETLGALDMQGVAAVAHTTWSHGKAPGLHSYRVFVDQVCDDWNELQAVTRELFQLCALEPTPESWHSPCFFVPAAPDSRRRLYRSSRTELEESEWEAKPFVPGLAVEREGPSHEASPEDEELVRSALERVENGPRDDWITVGMALCSSGIPDARGIWEEWSRSQGYADYSEDAQEHAWESFDPEASGGIGIGSILHMARERGWRRPRQRASAREDFAAFLHEVRGLNDAQAVMERTDASNAALLVRDHRHELRFVQSLNSWICFDGRRWRMDHGLSAKRFAKETATRIFQGVADLTGDARLLALRWAGRSNMAQGVRATIEMAQPDLEVSSSKLDPNPMLFNVSNGTLDLRTHELRPHDPADMITKVAPTAYDPEATCEHWERFLVDVLP
ncbi:MAG: PriCT-2 domain-containing protein, partial [Myxococcales bacterium]|nr:PriCT-2 domain-containing protein [Myxococcales bacterium]